MTTGRIALRLWCSWTGATIGVFVLNSVLGAALFGYAGPSPAWATTLNDIVLTLPWVLRAFYNSDTGRWKGFTRPKTWLKAILVGCGWFLLPRLAFAVAPIRFFPSAQPGPGQWWWMAGAFALAMYNQGVAARFWPAVFFFAYQLAAPLISHVVAAPSDPILHLFWPNLWFGLCAGTVIALGNIAHVWLTRRKAGQLFTEP